MAKIRIPFTLYSAFYSPLISTRAAAYQRTLDIFEHNGLTKSRCRYEQVCAAPPAAH